MWVAVEAAAVVATIEEITLTSEGFRIKIFDRGRERDGDGECTRVRKHDDGEEEGDDFDDADGERAEDEAGDSGKEGDDFDYADRERAEDEAYDGGRKTTPTRVLRALMALSPFVL
ncbi:hypothetical protein Scep_006926 [Stephania cephalantha]|uniref:Uncharacterized protein n=1 Tax=Stephania cephalantha TaxID=152367 RepID=A0AAP0KAI0_9MAGN